MNFLTENVGLHLELSDKCQASCPMCLRNYYGGREREHIKNTEIRVEQIKSWFPKEYLYNSVNHIYACGNNGDPLMAKDCLEIFKYFKESCKPKTSFSINTNGSLRNSKWWDELANIFGKQGAVIFGIDGFKGQHELYRRGTSFNKIIKNAKTFIKAGGRAKADIIIFKHNQDSVIELKKFLLDLGFEDVNLKPTNRFYGMQKFPVYNKNQDIEYYLEPLDDSRWTHRLPQPNFIRLVDKQEYKKMLDSAILEPQCIQGTSLYVSVIGKVYPCCYVGGLNLGIDIEKELGSEEKVIRNRLISEAVDMMNDIGHIDLNNSDIITQMKLVNWDKKINKYFTTDKPLVCVKNCSKNILEIIK